MKKIKVMHVLCMGEYSGAENVAITLINSMKDEVDSTYVSPKGIIQNILRDYEISYYSIDKIDIKNIKQAIKAVQPDIIHAHDFMAGVICAMASFNIPIVNHLHNNALWIKKLGIKSIVYLLLSWRYKKILTVSDSIMEEYFFGKCLQKKSMVIGNPISLQNIENKANEAVINEKSDILFLGRMSEPKNPLLFIEIVSEVVKKIPQLKVAMVGDGKLRMLVEQRIEELGLGDNIILWGFQNNPYGLLKNTRVVCMPSIWEGFGLAAVEALALGKPVVASPVGGLKNIVNNECGKLCDTLESYASTIVELLVNVQMYEQYCIQATKRAEQLDNIAAYKEKILGIYNLVHK